MARMVYVEPDEEITDLVERIRDLHDDGEIVFVLPNRSRVLQSVLNLRLLQQYARSFVREASIVTSDVRTQQLARDTGFAAYASVAAFERGVEASPGPDGGGGAGPGGAPPSEIAPAQYRETGPSPIGTPAALGAGAAAGATAAVATRRPAPRVPPPPAAGPSGVRGGDRRRGLYIGAGALFLLGLLLLFLVFPTAKVTVVLQASPVKEDALTIQGTPDTQAAGAPGKVLTAVVAADASSQIELKATGQKQLPAAAATATIQFSTDFTAPFCVRITKGSTLAESGSQRWVATDTPAHDPQCAATGVYVPGSSNGQFGLPSKAIGVTAAQPGAAQNVPAGAVNQVDPGINGCNPANYPTSGPVAPPNCSPKDFVVTNPAAAAGGVDAKTLTIVQDADLTAFKASQVDAVGKLTDQVKQAMQQKAPGRTFAVDPAKSGLTITTDVSPALPASGDQAPTSQQVTVTAHGRGAMFAVQDVKGILVQKLMADVAAVQPNATLDEKSRVIGEPVVQQAGDDGVVVFSISGSGYAIPSIDTQKLKDSFTGKSKSTVRTLVGQQYGTAVQDVQVSQAIPFPVLPFFSSRIEVSLCVRSPNQTC